MRRIVSAVSVACEFCGAPAGEPCREARLKSSGKLRTICGVHGARIRSADDVQRAMDALLGDA